MSTPDHDRHCAEDVAAAVAHDVNNVLTMISGNLALAERHAAGNPKLIRLLQNIRLAAERATALTVQLMTVAARPASDQLSSGPNSPPATSDEKRCRVLVVEDDPGVAEIAVAVIEQGTLAFRGRRFAPISLA